MYNFDWTEPHNRVSMSTTLKVSQARETGGSFILVFIIVLHNMVCAKP